jgi:ribokinase
MPVARQNRRVVVVGSVNSDLVVNLDRFPTAGETRIVADTATHLGGKGLSQAVAAAKFGSSVRLVASLGTDEQGDSARACLLDAGVDADGLRESPLPTGLAVVWVDARGENMIAVVPGANADLTALQPDDLAAIADAGVVLTQFESGVAIALETILAARASGAITILNAAPAISIPDDVLAALDLLVVNEVEVQQLRPAGNVDTAAASLASHVGGAVLVTLGSRGGRLYREGSAPLAIRAPRADVVDTTGAGDVSCGIIASALAQGEPLDEAVRLAFCAGALAVQRHGNASSIPSRDDVLRLAGRDLDS